jgi:acetyl esterase
MQLCTNARLFLDVIAASGEPKLWELTPPRARKKVLELTRMVECHEAVGRIENGILPGPAGPLSFRVYTPL